MSEMIGGGGVALTFFCDDKRHLVCRPYSKANLHRMADILGINRGWYHGGRFPHYDIPKRMIQRVSSRATLVTTRELLEIIKEGLREDGQAVRTAGQEG